MSNGGSWDQASNPEGSEREKKGAGERTRTVDIQLGKLTFYH